MTLTADSFVVASERQLSVDLGDAQAVLHTGSQRYYALRGIGAAIWQRLQAPIRVGALVEALVRDYEVEPQRCLTEVLDLLGRLAAAGLLQETAAPPSAAG
jgi:hypothetical protein